MSSHKNPSPKGSLPLPLSPFQETNLMYEALLRQNKMDMGAQRAKIKAISAMLDIQGAPASENTRRKLFKTLTAVKKLVVAHETILDIHNAVISLATELLRRCPGNDEGDTIEPIEASEVLDALCDSHWDLEDAFDRIMLSTNNRSMWYRNYLSAKMNEGAQMIHMTRSKLSQLQEDDVEVKIEK